jgi:hypothetical protein
VSDNLYIGLTGSGNDYELEIIRETSKAYLLKSWHGEEVWLPRRAFDETGTITEWGYKMLLNKLEEGK